MTIREVFHTAMDDEEFRESFKSNPEEALEKFELTKEEQSAILTGDEKSINEMIGESPEDMEHLAVGSPGYAVEYTDNQ